MKRKLFLVLIGLHFCVVVYNNMIIEEEAIKSFYFNDHSPSQLREVLISSPKVFSVFDFYSKYTGTETGFGFYAPNVSSDIVLMMTNVSKQGNIMSIEAPSFHSMEARVRYASALNMFMDKVGIQDEQHNKYMNAVLKSIALWNFRHKENLGTVIADLLIYDLPAPAMIKEKQNPTFLKLGRYEYSVK